jgi:hypothetical protein
MSSGATRKTPEVTDDQAQRAMELVRAYRRHQPGISRSQAVIAGRVVSRYLKEHDQRLAEQRKRRG